VSRKRDEETGQFSQKYERETFLDAITELETPTTAEIADFVGCSYDLAYRRLQKLEEEDTISKIEVGNSFLWNKK
jgi:DNA-binding Lrp family transcriptional regulator